MVIFLGLGESPGGKTYQCKNFGGAQALFSYVNLQIIDSLGGGGLKPCNIFIYGALSLFPLQVRDWLEGGERKLLKFGKKTRTYNI